MPTWNSEQYLKFARERTQPSVDLAARVDLAAPQRVVDLGSGMRLESEGLANDAYASFDQSAVRIEKRTGSS